MTAASAAYLNKAVELTGKKLALFPSSSPPALGLRKPSLQVYSGTQIMSDIEKLLQIDVDNVPVTQAVYREYHPQLFEVLEEATQLFKTFSRAYSQEAHDDDDLDIVNACGTTLRIVDGQSLFTLLTDPLPDEPTRAQVVRDGQDALHRIRSRRVRGFLLLLTFRSYMFAVTDLLRLRITSALGHLRVQIESVALMEVMKNNPEVAFAWTNIHDDSAGQKFFKKYQKPIAAFRKHYDLTQAWNMASGSSQHARFASMVQGLSQHSSVKGDRRADEYKLVFQESNTEPAYLILYTLYILRTQQRLFTALREALPEVNDPLLVNTRLPLFRSRVDGLWGHLEKAYPEHSARWRKKRQVP